MKDLIDTTEMYLRTIYELDEEGTPPLRARIAERLSQSGPTVSQTVARMERDGLLRVRSDRRIELSAKGHRQAARVMRKHRIAECLLLDLLKVDPDQIHEEACRWEHVMSDEVELKVLDALGHPAVSPFGNPIPALDELGEETVLPELPEGSTNLAALAGEQPQQAVVQRIDETAQLLVGAQQALVLAGLAAGSTVEFVLRDDFIVINAGNGDQTELSAEIAQHIVVLP
ncbi:MAG: dihydrofolate reductase [Micrococcales bacterium]|nr:dihydrofolate reductase [Micrococcales bacterium]